MKKTEEQINRAKCDCGDCRAVRRALSLLDDIATSPGTMSLEDSSDLCEARELLAHEVGMTYSPTLGRYERIRVY